MQKARIAAVVTGLVAVGATGATADSGVREHDRKGRSATAALVNAQGHKIGRVTFVQARGKVTVTVFGRGLSPGFHGFHVHTVGRCDAPGFMSAAGHFKRDDEAHGDHAGDLPVLLVDADRTVSAAFVTDRFKLADLRDADGSAVIVHSGRDNYANIPTRYAPVPDAETLNTGDAGTRVACGVIR